MSRSYGTKDSRTPNAQGSPSRKSRQLGLNVSHADFFAIRKLAVYNETTIAEVVRDYISLGLSRDAKLLKDIDE